jgi:hypothetical protein
MRQRLMWNLAVVALGALTLGACASTSARFMAEVAPPQPIVAPPGQAMVVFVRPSNLAFAVSANILDESGRFLGDIPAKGHFAAPMPPGRHMLVIWAENTDAMTVNLLPGRIYFVEVYASMGAWSAHMHLRAIKPSLPSWYQKDNWIVNSTQYVVDQMGGQANLAAKGMEAVQERLRRGQEHLAQYQGPDLDAHMLNEPDGL